MESTGTMKLSSLVPLAAIALAACGQSGPPAGESDAKSGELTIADGRIVLPAVSGNPGAAYFTLTNGSSEPATLAAASVAGTTKAEMHESSGTSMTPIANVTLGPGASVAFERGAKHVMLFGVKALKPGETAKLTLTFSGGKTAVAPLRIEAAGGTDGDAH